jgi:hypothetical protein
MYRRKETDKMRGKERLHKKMKAQQRQRRPRRTGEKKKIK